uniref:NADH dehydrogenase subunit 6 n=1 Tax=Knipowitschia caucasica TaxID=637954 RepID=A0AAV2MM76_KNICA
MFEPPSLSGAPFSVNLYNNPLSLLGWGGVGWFGVGWGGLGWGGLGWVELGWVPQSSAGGLCLGLCFVYSVSSCLLGRRSVLCER